MDPLRDNAYETLQVESHGGIIKVRFSVKAL